MNDPLEKMTKAQLIARIRADQEFNDPRKMDASRFQEWAACTFMTNLCQGQSPTSAMWIVVNQAAMNEVWGGKRNDS